MKIRELLQCKVLLVRDNQEGTQNHLNELFQQALDSGNYDKDGPEINYYQGFVDALCFLGYSVYGQRTLNHRVMLGGRADWKDLDRSMLSSVFENPQK